MNTHMSIQERQSRGRTPLARHCRWCIYMNVCLFSCERTHRYTYSFSRTLSYAFSHFPRWIRAPIESAYASSASIVDGEYPFMSGYIHLNARTHTHTCIYIYIFIYIYIYITSFQRRSISGSVAQGRSRPMGPVTRKTLSPCFSQYLWGGKRADSEKICLWLICVFQQGVT